MKKEVPFSTLTHKLMKSVVYDEANEVIKFTTLNNQCYEMYHNQDCCESVTVEDIVGDLKDLENLEILIAEKSTNEDEENSDILWTFYKLVTNKGAVTIRWSANTQSYYSTDVNFFEVSYAN